MSAGSGDMERTGTSVIGGRYELLELRGSGGMAQVWRARDTRLDREVAVKMLFGPATGDVTKRKRIEREARALAALDHPNIVAVYDYGEDAHDGQVRPYVVMELVDGPDLHRRLSKSGRLDPDESSELLAAVANAVSRAHEAGVIHGDLKPANILLDAHGPKVGDFGVARIVGEESGTTTAAATPSFAAPEVLRGARPLPQSDVYALGCIAFQMLTGRPPYEGANAWEVAIKHQEAPVPSVRDDRPEVSGDLDQVIRSSMAKDPGARPGVASFARQIAAARSTVPVSATMPLRERDVTQTLPRPVDLRSVALFGPFAVWASRMRARLGEAKMRRVVAAATLIVLGAVVAALGFGMRTPAPEQVSVPDVRGLTPAAAAAVLDSTRLDMSGVSYVVVTDGEAGLVVTTIPGTGQTVRPGTDVHLIAGARPATPTPPAGVKDDDNDDDEGGARGKGKRGRD